MPTYTYMCCDEACAIQFEVVKPLRELDVPETCLKCEGASQRRISRTNFTNAGDWKSQYNPAFGCVVKSKAHQREIMSRFKGEGREMIEVGNEPVENIHKHYDRQRAETREKKWAITAEQAIQETM